MDNVKEILAELRRNPAFVEQPDSRERHWHLIKDGKDVGLVYFKHVFGGWSLLEDGGKRTFIPDVEALKKLI